MAWCARQHLSSARAAVLVPRMGSSSLDVQSSDPPTSGGTGRQPRCELPLPPVSLILLTALNGPRVSSCLTSTMMSFLGAGTRMTHLWVSAPTQQGFTACCGTGGWLDVIWSLHGAAYTSAGRLDRQQRSMKYSKFLLGVRVPSPEGVQSRGQGAALQRLRAETRWGELGRQEHLAATACTAVTSLGTCISHPSSWLVASLFLPSHLPSLLDGKLVLCAQEDCARERKAVDKLAQGNARTH